jgi:GTP cyclohydrolase I
VLLAIENGVGVNETPDPHNTEEILAVKQKKLTFRKSNNPLAFASNRSLAVAALLLLSICLNVSVNHLKRTREDFKKWRIAGMSHSAARTQRSTAAARNGERANEVDRARIEAAVREILLAVGEDADREGLHETPARVARMYAEMFSGLHTDPRQFLSKTFAQKYDEMVLVRDIEFASMCEHHLLPFMGKAHIAYLPAGRIVGLSKLPRVVEALAHRPQVQERMTEELADLLMEEIKPRGVGVILEAAHTCMTIRGVKKPGGICTTSSMRGVFRDNQATRSELMALIYGPR